MPSTLTKTPMLLPAIILIASIAVGYNFISASDTQLLAIISAVCFGAALICLLFLRRYISVAFACIAMGGGLWLGNSIISKPFPNNLNEQNGTLVGTVEDIKTGNETVRLVVKAKNWTPKNDSVSHPVNFNVAATLYTGASIDIIKGATLTITGKLKSTVNDFDLPYQTDFNRYLAAEKVVARISAFNPDDYSISNRSASRFQRFFSDCRASWLDAISSSGFDEPTTRFLLAVVGGQDSLLSENLEEQFRETGMAHILAISGLHVAIIMAVLAFLLYPLKPGRRSRYLFFILIGVGVAVYAFVTGGSPSAVRAALMGCVLMGDRIFETRRNGLQALSTAIVVMLVVRPSWLFAPGFQLSVCGVLSLLAFMPILQMVSPKHKLLRAVWVAATVPVIAVTGTLIPTLYYFHSFAFNFWFANILGAAFVPIVISTGFLGSLLTLIGLHFPIVETVCNFAYGLFTNCIEAASKLFGSGRTDIVADSYTLVVVALIIVILAWLAHNYTHRRAAWVGAVAIAAALFIAVMPAEAENNPSTEIYIPRHGKTTDVLIIFEGENYIWSSAKTSAECQAAVDNAKKLYIDFYRHRRVATTPVPLTSSGKSRGALTLSDNTLTINDKRIIRIDTVITNNNFTHTDIALISERFAGNITDIKDYINSDTIILSTAIHYSRLQKFKRQLDTLGIPYRQLSEKALVWQFQ